MSTHNDPAPDDPLPAADEDQREPVLEPKLPRAWALGLAHVLLVAWLGVLFTLANHFSLRPTDIWGHVSYGHWILQNRALPAHDPFCPLAQPTPVVDYAWLAQVVFAAVDGWGGAEWLSHVFALTVLATQLVLARAFFLQAQSVIAAQSPGQRESWPDWPSIVQSRALLATLLGLIAVTGVSFSRISTIRPENFGMLAMACLVALIAALEGGAIPAQRASAKRFLAIAMGVVIVVTLWTNLHGTFVCGLAMLGCYLLGQAIEAVWEARSLWAVLTDRPLRRWLVLCVLGAAASLLNPYGLRLLEFTASFGHNGNVQDIVEWKPLVLVGMGGVEFALSWVVLTIVLRHSRRRFRPAHALLLATFATAAAFQNRMLGPYAIVFGWVLVPHLADIIGRMAPAAGKIDKHLMCETPDDLGGSHVPGVDPTTLPPGRSWWYSLLCVLLVWIAFAVSPISAAVLGRQPRSAQRLYGAMTPVALTEYLRSNPPSGLIYNPQWWGDWLVRAGPANLQPFVTTNVHLMPPLVWQDYMRVLAMAPGWQEVFERYAIRTAVFDRKDQPRLVAAFRRRPGWAVAYEDEQAVVFARSEPPRT